MAHRIKNLKVLRTILWIDAVMGSVTALVGLLFFSWLTNLLGLPAIVLLFISTITLLYAFVAIRLAIQPIPSIRLLNVLIYANWFWTVVSLLLFLKYYGLATSFGVAFLILQILVVGGLAFAEGKQLARTSALMDQ